MYAIPIMSVRNHITQWRREKWDLYYLISRIEVSRNAAKYMVGWYSTHYWYLVHILQTFVSSGFTLISSHQNRQLFVWGLTLQWRKFAQPMYRAGWKGQRFLFRYMLHPVIDGSWWKNALASVFTSERTVTHSFYSTPRHDQLNYL